MGCIGCVCCENIPMGLHGMKFFTSLTRFAPSFVRQPNSPKCTKIKQIAWKQKFSVQWGGSGAFVAKRSNGTSWHELLHQFGPFCLEFFMATKRSKCTQIVRNAPKHEFRVQWGGSRAFVAKRSNGTSWHELSHQFCTFSIKFCEPTKQSQLH